jgi:hypothetical protein
VTGALSPIGPTLAALVAKLPLPSNETRKLAEGARGWGEAHTAPARPPNLHARPLRKRLVQQGAERP